MHVVLSLGTYLRRGFHVGPILDQAFDQPVPVKLGSYVNGGYASLQAMLEKLAYFKLE